MMVYLSILLLMASSQFVHSQSTKTWDGFVKLHVHGSGASVCVLTELVFDVA